MKICVQSVRFNSIRFVSISFDKVLEGLLIIIIPVKGSEEERGIEGCKWLGFRCRYNGVKWGASSSLVCTSRNVHTCVMLLLSSSSYSSFPFISLLHSYTGGRIEMEINGVVIVVTWIIHLQPAYSPYITHPYGLFSNLTQICWTSARHQIKKNTLRSPFSHSFTHSSRSFIASIPFRSINS